MRLNTIETWEQSTEGASVASWPDSILQQTRMVPSVEGTNVLSVAEWQERERVHEARVRQWTDPHQARAARGQKHPVYDFLFDYYAYRPSWLRRWHPGVGTCLEGEAAREFLGWSEYREDERGIAVDPAQLKPSRLGTVKWLLDVLRGMQDRPAFFGCFGFHEWAMVYREAGDTIRYPDWPLRFPMVEIDRIVKAQTLCCTHHDAFRFFTPPARPLNRTQPTRIGVPAQEQRGCLHANMDLYKWSFKLAPYTPSELMADCFAFAREIREVDMRASPYDFRSLGFEPIEIETSEGRAEYEVQQRTFASRGEPLRARIIEVCERILKSVTG